jgi:hypothetical protein
LTRVERSSLSVPLQQGDLFLSFPLSFILYPLPFTLYPLPFTLYPLPFTLYPLPFILNTLSFFPFSFFSLFLFPFSFFLFPFSFFLFPIPFPIPFPFPFRTIYFYCSPWQQGIFFYLCTYFWFWCMATYKQSTGCKKNLILQDYTC